MIGEAFGLYTHIRRNRWRSWFLIAGLFVLVMMITFAITLMIDGQTRYAPLDDHLAYAARQTLIYAPISLAITGLWVLIGFSANVAMINWATGRSRSPASRRLACGSSPRICAFRAAWPCRGSRSSIRMR